MRTIQWCGIPAAAYSIRFSAVSAEIECCETISSTISASLAIGLPDQRPLLSSGRHRFPGVTPRSVLDYGS
jgi:hypothetical protein